MRRFVPIVLGIVTFLLIGWYVQHLRAERDDALIAAHDAIAARDTLVLLRQTDSTRIVGQLATYHGAVVSPRDQLSNNAAGTSKTVTTLTVAARQTHTEHTTPPVLAGGDAVYTDSVIGPPADARVTVTVTDSVRWDWTIQPTPIPLTIDVGCRARLKPDVIIEAPDWTRISGVKTNLDERLCDHANAVGPPKWFSLRVRPYVVVGYDMINNDFYGSGGVATDGRISVFAEASTSRFRRAVRAGIEGELTEIF